MKGFLSALHFLTRINFNFRIKSEEDFRNSIVFFPLIGILIGSIIALLAYIFSPVMQPVTVAVIIVIAEVLITGGLHLDGLMDSCDALFSGRERDKKLSIMKDSRVGAMGVLGLVILLMLKVVLLLELSCEIYLHVLLVMPMMGRWAMVYAIGMFPYAREEGMGIIFKQGTPYNLLWSSLYSTAVFAFIMPWQFYATLPLAALTNYFVCRKVNSLLLGHTGDTYGMVNETTEVLFLLWCVLVVKFY